MPQVNPLWEDDYVQFARLLAELQGVVNEAQYDHLRMSMDLENSDIDELFDRACVAWERIKARTLPPPEAY